MKSAKKHMNLSNEQRKWVLRHRRYASKDSLQGLLSKQKGKCHFSGVEMYFDKKRGTPPCHPLYASIDHEEPGNQNSRLNIVCYALNDLKGYLPEDFFKNTKGWKRFIKKWRNQNKKSRNRKAFKHLIRP